MERGFFILEITETEHQCTKAKKYLNVKWTQESTAVTLWWWVGVGDDWPWATAETEFGDYRVLTLLGEHDLREEGTWEIRSVGEKSFKKTGRDRDEGWWLGKIVGGENTAGDQKG